MEADWDVVVVGAGAAGLVAGGTAAMRGQRTLLLEKNRKPGVKILMSGGTRCNITQATDNRGIVEAYGPPGRFLHSALAALSVADTIALFESEGVPTKTESTGKIFPQSDKAADVLAALLRRLERSGCTLALEEPLAEVARQRDGVRLVTPRRTLHARNLLITTGGQSYPGSGTTGDGYRFAAQFGHTIVEPRPALVPVTTDAAWVRELRGVTVPDVTVRVLEPRAEGKRGKPRVLAERRGSLLFAHFGLSGPAALDVSRAISGHPQPRTLALVFDFLPELTVEALENLLREQASAAGKRTLVGLLGEHLPRRLCEALLAESGLDSQLKLAEVGAKRRGEVAAAIKSQSVTPSGTRGFAKAEVTAGGVALGEVDSRTMQSKLAERLYLAGEVLDLDGPIGGYNFQAAWSTGHLAGLSVE
ncbi:MAG: NAD(P)/FAD-dependent oxidoreductase [Planctomycetota bacterium]|nr:MAG: NAD(P)/FAD-dependent oxidoreductase [Planctomycetota bacterium]